MCLGAAESGPRFVLMARARGNETRTRAGKTHLHSAWSSTGFKPAALGRQRCWAAAPVILCALNTWKGA